MESIQFSSREEIFKMYNDLHLNPEGDNIRVLNLLAGIGRSKLRGVLKVVSMDSKLPYEALSYTWGSANRGRSIVLNDKYQLSITDNLFQALIRLRKSLKERTLWVDAVCINQANDTEKSDQVRRMGSIYFHASCVNVWLGEPGFVFPINRGLWIYWPWVRACNREGYYWNLRNTQLFGSLLRAFWLLLTNHGKAMNRAIQRSSPPWHTRAWVVQEFVEANEVQFCYGRRRSQYDDLHWHHLGPVLCKPRDNLTYLEQFREYIQRDLHYLRVMGARRVGLLDLPRQLIGSTEVTDPRDKIYSVVTLLEKKEADLMKPDYTLSAGEVFAKATFASMAAQKETKILGLVAFTKRRTIGLPTWAVDFTDASRLLEAHVGINEFPVLESLSNFSPNFDVGSKDLRLPGYTLDVVTNVMPLASNAILTKYNEGNGERLPLEARDKLDSLIRGAMKSVREVASRTPYETGSSLLADSTATHLFHQWRIEAAALGADPTTLDVVRERKPAAMSALQSTGRIVDMEQRPFDVVEDALKRWATFMMTEVFGRDWDRKTELGALEYDKWEFGKYAIAAACQCSLFSTSSGLVGLAPSSIALGNTIILTCTRDRPFLVLGQSEGFHEFRGLALMFGFLRWKYHPWDSATSAGLQAEEFVLR